MLSDLNTNHFWGHSESAKHECETRIATTKKVAEPINVNVCIFDPLLDEGES
jgi:hypothetical protein